MKIAVPVTKDNRVDDHFGHCEFYNVFTISDSNEIEASEVIASTQGCGCKSNIASTLAQNGVTTLLAGGIGGGAINVLNSAGIEVIRGCSGVPEEVVKQYIAGLIADSGETCEAHSHDNGHVCSH